MKIKDLLGKPSPTITGLADHYDLSVLDIMDALITGIEVEKEHTLDERLAMEIALDHLGEDLKYYTKLKKMEAK